MRLLGRRVKKYVPVSTVFWGLMHLLVLHLFWNYKGTVGILLCVAVLYVIAWGTEDVPKDYVP